jgi:glycosyltransferase involved in cell wall biosynthesis
MKIAVLTSDPYSIFRHRLDLVVDFVKSGHEVLIVSSENDSLKDKFSQYNLRFRHVRLTRNGINPFKDIQTFLDFYRILKEEKPDKVFAYQAKAVVYGCWAAERCEIKDTYIMLTGLGSVLRENKKYLKYKILHFILKRLYKHAIKCSKYVFFQNVDDRRIMVKMTSLPLNKTIIVNGSGVDIQAFTQSPMPSIPVFLYIGRLIRDKGICEYLEACRIIKRKYRHVRCMLVGPFDTNPSAVKESDLKPYIEDDSIEYAGEQDDVRPFIIQCSTYVLPSYHEGTPHSVLQAMAMGRAIITTDAPGCRETVKNGENGFLIPVKNVEAVVEKMEYLINNPAINAKMGEQSRVVAEEKYYIRKVNKAIFEVMELNYPNNILPQSDLNYDVPQGFGRARPF